MRTTSNKQQPSRFVAVRIAIPLIDGLEDFRHQRSKECGKRVSLRTLMNEALELYLRRRRSH